MQVTRRVPGKCFSKMSISEDLGDSLNQTRDYSAQKDLLHEAIQRIEDRLSKIEFNQDSFRVALRQQQLPLD